MRALARHLGPAGAMRAVLRLAFDTIRGRPFQGLPRPWDAREAACRTQIGPAILLFQGLCGGGMTREGALAVVEDVVVSAGVIQMRRSLGTIRPSVLTAMSEDERLAWLRDRAGAFPNAKIRWDRIGDDEVSFTALDCRFPALCEEAGAPEVAPLACRVDDAFFGHEEPGIELSRPHTKAQGADDCPFTLRPTRRS